MLWITRMPHILLLLVFFLPSMISLLDEDRVFCAKREKALSALNVVKKFLLNAQDVALKNDDVYPNRKLPSCDTHDISLAYLELATEWISAITKNCQIDSKPAEQRELTKKPKDCSDVLEMGYNVSDVYPIWPDNLSPDNKPFHVYCDMDTNGGGWTVIQRRGNFTNQQNFYRDWKSYKYGFGNLQKDFWLGNDKIYTLSNQDSYTIRFELTSTNGSRRYAVYETFWIEDEDNGYKLHIEGFGGNAGDSMAYHSNNLFSTKDRDNDYSPLNCAQERRGGWWYKGCTETNLNGLYSPLIDDDKSGMFWLSFQDYDSLSASEIKLGRQ